MPSSIEENWVSISLLQFINKPIVRNLIIRKYDTLWRVIISNYFFVTSKVGNVLFYSRNLAKKYTVILLT